MMVIKSSNLEDNLISTWSEFIDECKSIYNENRFELDYDILVREEINQLFEDDKFIKSDKFELFKARLNDLDNSFLELVHFTSDDDIDMPFWKRKFVLMNGGSNYQKSIKL